MKERRKTTIKKRSAGIGLLAAAVLLAVAVTVVKGYGMDFGGFDVNVGDGDYVGEEFPVWEEAPGQVPAEPTWPENPVERPSEQFPQEPVWPEEPSQEPWPPESIWQEGASQEPWPSEFIWQEKRPYEQLPPEMIWQENFSWEQSPPEQSWQEQIPPKQPSTGQNDSETSWKAQIPTPVLTVTPVPLPTVIPKPTAAPIPTKKPTPTEKPTPSKIPVPTKIPISVPSLTPMPGQNSVSSPVFHLIEKNGGHLEIEVQSEERVQILSLRINGRECPWHWERDTILVDMEIEDMENKIEILAFSANGR